MISFARRQPVLCMVWLLFGFASLALQAAEPARVKFDEQAFAILDEKNLPALEVKAGTPKELSSALQIYTGKYNEKKFDPASVAKLDRDKKRAVLPFSELSEPFKKQLVLKLWPKDKIEGGFWIHDVIYPSETLWSIAEIWTGKGTSFKEIMKHTKLKKERVVKGARLKIPLDLLIPALRPMPKLAVTKLQDPLFVSQTPVVEEQEIKEAERKPLPAILEDAGSSQAAETVAPSKEPRQTDAQATKDRPDQSTREPAKAAPPKPETHKQTSSKSRPDKAQPGPAMTESPKLAQAQAQVPVSGSESGRGAKPAQPENVAVAESEEETVPLPTPLEVDEVSKQLEEIEELRRDLNWGRDKKGRFASYRLKPGEAIYSSVVIRFCGLVSAAEVNALAKVIIERNDIADVTDLAVGTAIKIPYENLEPAFKDIDDPDYISVISNLRDLSQISTSLRTKNLEGVHIILDPGHGGRDPGAIFGNVWEDDYVYDIVCRIKARLERESSAVVITTVLDPSTKFEPQDVRDFEMDDDEVLQTRPPFKLSGERAINDGVNLRWVYANYWYARWAKEGVKPENMLFASIHADSLHPSLRGKMIYVPDAQIFPVNVNAPTNFRQFHEYEGGQFKFDQKTMQQAQARSINFAHRLLDANRMSNILVHTQRPVRSMIYRNRNQPFVPAVLRFNRIPTRCLIEVCNLSNKDDREQMRDPGFRQKVADSFVAAVYSAFGAQPNKTVSATAPSVKGKIR